MQRDGKKKNRWLTRNEERIGVVETLAYNIGQVNAGAFLARCQSLDDDDNIGGGLKMVQWASRWMKLIEIGSGCGTVPVSPLYLTVLLDSG